MQFKVVFHNFKQKKMHFQDIFDKSPTFVKSKTNGEYFYATKAKTLLRLGGEVVDSVNIYSLKNYIPTNHELLWRFCDDLEIVSLDVVPFEFKTKVKEKITKS
jgi:hypothetical protein